MDIILDNYLFTFIFYLTVMDPQQNPNKFVRLKNNVKAPNEKINVFKRLG